MLTAKQHQTYQFIKDFIAEQGYAPTEAEIAEAIGIKSTGVVHRYVTALSEAGFIELTPNRRRNIRLSALESSDHVADFGDITGRQTHGKEANDSLPILGKIAAGSPIEAIDQNNHLDIAAKLCGPQRFILLVSGNSMIGDNICDGDYIICEQKQTAPDNAIVVAMIDQNEATLKRMKRNKDGSVMLIPSNPSLTPMIYPADRVSIQGIFIGLLRFTY